MKKSTLIILLVLAVLKANAQDYYITFAAEGDTNQVGTVTVKNLTSGDSIMLSGGDVLHLVPVSGIAPAGSNHNAMTVYPNPMKEQSWLTFVAPESGSAFISISDLSGKLICQGSYMLSAGQQRFRLSGIRQGLFFVKVTGTNYTRSAKLVSQGTPEGGARIEFVSSEKQGTGNPLKSSFNEFPWGYAIGNVLNFKGNSGNYNTVVSYVPTSSTIISFHFNFCMDKDGHWYSTVLLGNQTWMAENLNASHYQNGSLITYITDPSYWEIYDLGACCDYNNDSAYSITYGKLYNFYAAASPNNICPNGWHVPSDAEWSQLTTFIGAGNEGGKLKETGTLHWLSPNAGATDETGFTALPGGARWADGTYLGLGEVGCFWSATEDSGTSSWNRAMNNTSDDVTRQVSNKHLGYSVRCVKN